MRSDDYCRDEEVKDNSPDYYLLSATSEIRDSLLDEAARLVVRYQQASISFLQRKLNISYHRASRILDQLETDGIIASHQGPGGRKMVIVGLDKMKEERSSEENPSRLELPKSNPQASEKPQYAESVKAMNGCLKGVLDVFVYTFLIVLVLCLSPLIILVLLVWWIVAWVLGLLCPGKEFMPLGKVWNSSKQWMYDKLGIDLEKVLGGAVLAIIITAIMGFLGNIFSRDK